MTTREFEIQDPPEDLSEEAKRLYRLHTGVGTLRTPGAVASFVVGLRALDVAMEAVTALKKSGLTDVSKRSALTRTRPEWRLYTEAMQTWLKTVKMLNLTLNLTANEDGLGYRDAFRAIATKGENDPGV